MRHTTTTKDGKTTSNTSSSGKSSPTGKGKLECKGGDGPTIALESLNNHTDTNGVRGEGGIAHWCDSYWTQLIATGPVDFDEPWYNTDYSTTANLTVTTKDCPKSLGVPYEDCLSWWGEIANGCDTDSSNKHGGTYEIGCLTLEMDIEEAS